MREERLDMRQHGFSRYCQRKPDVVDEGIVNLTCCKQNGTHSPSDDIAVLIDRAPEILSLALNRGKDFVDMPRIP